MMQKVIVIAGLMVATSAVVSAESWENDLNLGFSLSKGNTDNTLLRLGVQTAKKDAQDAYFGSFHYTYGEKDDEANEDEFLAKATWKRVLKGKNFLGLRFDARRDRFAAIDYRFSFNSTYGYYWVDSESTVFSTEFGVGLTSEDIDDDQDTYINGLFDQHFEHRFNEAAKFYQDLTFAPRIDHLDDYRVVFEMGLETQITKTVAFKVSFENRYESMPAEDKEKNDLKFITGLSYKF